MKTILLSAVLLFSVFSFSQEIEILNQNQYFTSSQKQKEFYYIAKDLDNSVGKKVADAKFVVAREGKKTSLSPVFYALWKKANALGANAFYVSQANYKEDKKVYDIVVELWFLEDEEIDQNFDLYPKNLIVMVGDINAKKEDKGKTFKLNGEKQTVMPYSFYVYQNEIGNKASVNIGGSFSGTTATFVGEENKLPTFLSLGGSAIMPNVATSGGISISFSSGALARTDMNLGMFLMDVLSKNKVEQ